METWLDWARGPLFVFSFGFMVLGLLRHLALTLWGVAKNMRRAGDKTYPYKMIVTSTLKWLFPLDKVREQFFFSLTSILFHAAILIVPIFLGGHITLWVKGAGISWPAISNGLADVLTIVAIVTAVALVIQRMAAKATRALSRFQDYALPLIIALPFASGFMVMHPWINPFSYEAVLLTHVMSANLVMILIPVTKLTHAALLPGVQLVSEVGWHWPQDGGSRVAAALGKENVPV
jgi:nitrate reductase gamma subunit